MGEPDEDQESPLGGLAKRIGHGIGIVLAVLLVVGLGVGTVLVVVDLYPERLPSKSDPSLIDTVFDSRIVVAAARIALLFAGGYVVISVVGLIARRQWLTRVGPFEASQAVAELDQEAELLRAELDDARQTIDFLEDRLSESDQALADAANLIGVLSTMDHLEEGDQEGGE